MGCNPITGPDSFATRHLSGCMPNSLKRSHSKLAAAFEGALTRTFAVGFLVMMVQMVRTRVVVLPVPGGPHRSKGSKVSKGGGPHISKGSKLASRNCFCWTFRCVSHAAAAGGWIIRLVLSSWAMILSAKSTARCLLRKGMRLMPKLTVKGGLLWKVGWKQTITAESFGQTAWMKPRCWGYPRDLT